MSEHVFIEKRRKDRAKPLLGTRNIIGLIILSLVVYGGFSLWVGNPQRAECGDNCSTMYSLLAYVMGFGMVFAALIAVAALVGVMVAIIRARRTPSVLLGADFEDEKGPTGTP